MTKEEIIKLLSHKQDVLLIYDIAKDAPYSVFETRPVKDIQNDIATWVYEMYMDIKRNKNNQ